MIMSDEFSPTLNLNFVAQSLKFWRVSDKAAVGKACTI
jgi:hypothetical protein